MKLLYFSSIILSAILLSTNLNSMELTRTSRGQEFLAKLTDNNKLELTQTTKEEIARYCIQRIKCGKDATQITTEVEYKLSSGFMYHFLKTNAVLSVLSSVVKKEPQNVDTHTDMRLFYCFPQMVEKSYLDIACNNIVTSAAYIQQATQKECLQYHNKIEQLNRNELDKIKCNESIKLAEDILESLKDDAILAKNIFLLKDRKLDSEQLQTLSNNLNQLSLVSAIELIFDHAYAKIILGQ